MVVVDQLIKRAHFIPTTTNNASATQTAGLVIKVFHGPRYVLMSWVSRRLMS